MVWIDLSKSIPPLAHRGGAWQPCQNQTIVEGVPASGNAVLRILTVKFVFKVSTLRSKLQCSGATPLQHRHSMGTPLVAWPPRRPGLAICSVLVVPRRRCRWACLCITRTSLRCVRLRAGIPHSFCALCCLPPTWLPGETVTADYDSKVVGDTSITLH
jgi:hypothetical protein